MRAPEWLAGSALMTLAICAHAEMTTVTVQRATAAPQYVAEGVVEAVRESVVAAQTSGQITSLTVTAGDAVKAGQVLLRIDERIAAEQAAAVRAQLDAARLDYERNRQLFAAQHISKAAMDRAEAQYKSLRAQLGGADTQTRLHTIEAPYAGIVTSVEVELGDMAMPGRALLKIYDPARMRVVVSVPESVAAELRRDQVATITISGKAGAAQTETATAIEVLPTRDATTHGAQVRLSLPSVPGIAPGQFARATLPLQADSKRPVNLVIPRSAVVQRTEFTGVYVLNSAGKPQLRQVRLGREQGDSIEVLAGLAAGERIALDPIAAAQQ
jgi:RND family efflux transporter MFP subunit